MKVGETIQKYRKDLGLSQEALGQKLLVSRQTISLWETDQTAPTIDNLIRLKEIFGVSIDKILGLETEETDIKLDIEPNESYQLNYSKAELTKFFRIEKMKLFKRAAVFIVLFLFLLTDSLSVSKGILNFLYGILFCGLIAHIKAIYSFSKICKNRVQRMSEVTYEYQIFDDYIIANLYRNNEIFHNIKCYFNSIVQIQIFDNWLTFQAGEQLYIIRRNDLPENSAFYSLIPEKAQKAAKIMPPDKWKILSLILFIASLLSLLGATYAMAVVSSLNHLSVENSWILFLFTPIPIASIIFGSKSKKKGYPYKKNTITGIIMLILLCLYGSFSFIFSGLYTHTEDPVINIEEMLGIDIPSYRRINTQDWTVGTQTTTRGYLYYTSDIYFDDEDVIDFEEQIQTDERWLSSVPSELIGITSPYGDTKLYDHLLIYNMDEQQYNTLPETSGNYHFINILYHSDRNQMIIVEYDIDYTK